VVVKNVTINPDPVVSGEEMTFIVPAYTGEWFDSQLVQCV